MSRDAGIYVEILIGAEVEEIWRRTQVPDIHQLWDLRFSGIHYLPKQSDKEPQRFRYSTRIGLGLKIDGEGESTGMREDATGLRTSALRFWSSDPKSLIEEGSGYWQYVPVNGGIRFLTWYDYRTRLGAAGRLIDRILFRPLIGWATAWSFDRLRLWIERGIPPQFSLRMAVIHALARSAIAFTWLWQGLMPKLLFPNIDERTMMAAAGLPQTLLPLIAALELGFAVLVVVLWRWRPLFLLNALFMIVALAVVALQAPSYTVSAFNPVTLNIGMIVLSLIGYLSAADVPSAARCIRQAPRNIS